MTWNCRGYVFDSDFSVVASFFPLGCGSFFFGELIDFSLQVFSFHIISIYLFTKIFNRYILIVVLSLMEPKRWT